MLLDYASTLRAGQSLVPDMRLQAMQDEQFAMQREEHDLRRDAARRQTEERERAAQETAEFQLAWEQVALGGGRPEDITRLAVRFPQRFEALKPALELMDKAQLKEDITATGSIYSRLNAGDPQGAAAMLRKRVEADRAAGTPDPQDEALLSALESGDEREIKVAQSMIGTQLAALTGVDTFKAVYGGNETKDPTQREYDWRVERFGKPAADAWLATEDTKLIAGQPGGKVLAFGPTGTSEVLVDESEGLVATPEQEAESASVAQRLGLPFEGASSDQAAQAYGAPRDGGTRVHNGLDFSGTLGTPIRPVLPGTVVAVGSDERSGRFVKVKHGDGRVSSYSHLGDVSVAKGQSVDGSATLGTLGRSGNASAAEGRGVLHFVMRDKDGKPVNPTSLFGGPVRVRSVQEARKLPPGTRFTTPDGRSGTRP